MAILKIPVHELQILQQQITGTITVLSETSMVDANPEINEKVYHLSKFLTVINQVLNSKNKKKRGHFMRKIA